MPAGARPPLALLTLLVAVGLVMAAQAFTQTDTPEIQLQLGRLLYADGRFSEALTAYEHAVGSPEPRVRVPARIGLVQSALRIGSFQKARTAGRGAAATSSRRTPSRLAVYGDAMWSAGLFDEADGATSEALALQPEEARGHNGVARVLSARGRYDEALEHSLQAVRLDAARGRLSPHARQRLRAARALRPWGHGAGELHQPAPEGPQPTAAPPGRPPSSSS